MQNEHQLNSMNTTSLSSKIKLVYDDILNQKIEMAKEWRDRYSVNNSEQWFMALIGITGYVDELTILSDAQLSAMLEVHKDYWLWIINLAGRTVRLGHSEAIPTDWSEIMSKLWLDYISKITEMAEIPLKLSYEDAYWRIRCEQLSEEVMRENCNILIDKAANKATSSS